MKVLSDGPEEIIKQQLGVLDRFSFAQRTQEGEHRYLDMGTAHAVLTDAIRAAWFGGIAWQMARQMPTVLLVDNVDAFAAQLEADQAAAKKRTEPDTLP